jgi:hypothetical protein
MKPPTRSNVKDALDGIAGRIAEAVYRRDVQSLRDKQPVLFSSGSPTPQENGRFLVNVLYLE